MKAQAKKILALIMAMVMCLSLAAPAFAVKTGTPSTTSGVTSAVVTVEAENNEWATGTNPGDIQYNGADVIVFVKGGVAYGLKQGTDYPAVTLDGKDPAKDDVEITVDDSDTFKLTSASDFQYIGENMILSVTAATEPDGSGVKANEVLVNGQSYNVRADSKIDNPTAFATDGKAGKYVVDSGVETQWSITGSTDKSGNYTVNSIEAGGTYAVAKDDDAAKNAVITPNAAFAGVVTKSSQPSGVKVDKDAGKNLIGVEMSSDSYTVTYNGKKATVTMGDDSGKKKSFSDLDASVWTALPDGQTFDATGKTYQVKGSVYQEPQGDTGLVKAYFKLNLADERNNWTSDTVYYVNTTAQATISAAGMGAVLADAVYCSDDYGTPSEVAITNDNVDNKTKVAVPTKTLPADDVVVYGFTAVNPSKDLNATGSKATVTSPAASGKVKVWFKSGTEVKEGSFQVSIKSSTIKSTSTADPVEAYVTDPAQAEAILKKNWDSTDAKLESVTAGTGNYVTVNVSLMATATAYAFTDDDGNGLYGKNVWYYNSGTKLEPVLVDMAEAGWYNGATSQGANAKQIPADTVALGPVIVRKSDVPAGVKIYDKSVSTTATATPNSDGYYIFNKVEDIKLEATDCKSAKSVPYATLTLNPWKGDKQNKLVEKVEKAVPVADKDSLVYSASGAVKKNAVTDALQQDINFEVAPVSKFYSEAFNTPNAEFVQKGTLTIDAASHLGPKVEVVEKTDATCEKPGTKTVKVKCTYCNQIISETTSEIPVVTDPVEVNTKDTTLDAEGETVPLMVFDDTAKATRATDHYLKKAVTTTTVSEDKTSTVVTTEFYCNFGVKHPDKTRTVILKKTSLQNGGRWNFISWDGRNEEKVITGSGTSADTETNLWGFTDGITIADSDAELEGLPLNRKDSAIPTTGNKTTEFKTGDTMPGNRPGTYGSAGDDLVIHFSGFTGAKNADGTWTEFKTVRLDNVYATVASTPETKYYVAKLTGKVTKDPVYTCHTGAATLTVEVYEVAKDAAGWTTSGTVLTDAENTIGETNLEKNVSKGKVKLLQTFTKDVVIRAQTYHNYDDKTGICTICLQGVQAVEDVKFDATTITVESLNWTGKAAQPKVTVYDTKGNKLVKGIDYAVEQVEETDAGEHDITIVGQDTYKASRATVKYTINKVAATLKKKSAPSKLTASATKKVTGQIKMTVKGGKVSAYKVTGKVSGVSVNKKGKITVKKANKKAGTLKVKVTMTPDANHTAAKAVTVKVAIKAAPAAKKTTKK